jgi:hypothetical protein
LQVFLLPLSCTHFFFKFLPGDALSMTFVIEFMVYDSVSHNLPGDHLQLPPTVLSDEAARKGLSVTLFERLQALWGNPQSPGDTSASAMLVMQYRMNTAIMEWSSNELYQVGLYDKCGNL